MRFDGTVAIVTGASTGIGAATAKALAAEGARVALLARDVRRLREQAGVIGASALAVECDVSDEAAVERAIASVESTFGPVTALVNNAGQVQPRQLVEMSLDEWEETFAVNARGTFLVTRRVLPGMIASGGGAIVNVASISGVIGPQKFPGFTSYCAAKAAVIAMTEVLAIEVAAHGVRVNAISPGSVDTGMWASVSGGASAEMTPDEVARSIVFLLSEESRPMNGRNLHVWS